MIKKKRLLQIGFAITIFILAFTAYHLMKDNIFKPKPKIAIVIDDWGYNLNNIESLFQIKKPITVAVLPNLRYSKYIASEAKKKGYEVILHLPLESKSNKNPEAGIIRCSMADAEVIKRLDKAFEGVPKASGVNNHQGSRATEDASLMKVVLSYIKKRNLFFLDSITTNRSVCASVCKDLRVRYVKRDIFLDLPERKLKGENLKNYIRGQLDKSAKIAIAEGHAVAIGHDRPATHSVIKEMVPELERRGIRIVRASELVRKQ